VSRELSEFRKDRIEALSSMDEQKIRSFWEKWNSSLPQLPEGEVFWGAVHKAITSSTDLPMALRSASKKWLQDRGYTAWDDGDVPVAAHPPTEPKG
jgi:hypothetical protein